MKFVIEYLIHTNRASGLFSGRKLNASNSLAWTNIIFSSVSKSNKNTESIEFHVVKKKKIKNNFGFYVAKGSVGYPAPESNGKDHFFGFFLSFSMSAYFHAFCIMCDWIYFHWNNHRKGDIIWNNIFIRFLLNRWSIAGGIHNTRNRTTLVSMENFYLKLSTRRKRIVCVKMNNSA